MAVLDLSADQLLIDNLETVTLTSEGGPYNITNAYRTRHDTSNQDHAGGDYWHLDTTFHLPIHALALPKVGDTILAADPVFGGNVTFSIIEVREPAYNDAWICRCRDAAISLLVALSEQVRLYRAVESTDDWGSTITTHPNFDAAFGWIHAAITLRPSDVVDEMGQRDFVEVYDIHVAEDIGTVHDGDLLLDKDGHWYTITSYRNRQQIDELSVMVCEDRLR